MAAGLGLGSVRAGEDDESRSMGAESERVVTLLRREWDRLLRSKTDEEGVVGEGVIG